MRKEIDGVPLEKKSDFTMAYYDWIACLLAAYAKTGVPPSLFVQRSDSKLKESPGESRQLAIEVWMSMRTGESSSLEDHFVALAWVENVFHIGARTLSRMRKSMKDDPVADRIVGHCRAIAEAIKQNLTPDLLRAAIESGWTGCEMRGVTPMREVHHLLRLVREWLPEASRPPERFVPRADW